MNIGIIGLGYVGIQLALALGQRYRTIGFDLDLSKISAYRSGVDKTGEVSAEQFRDKPVLLNIFPSVDTPVCAASVRTFNERAAASGVSVLCVSKDLPFAQKRFCGAEDIENVTTASAFRDSFGEDFGITIADGPMAGLLARAVVVVGLAAIAVGINMWRLWPYTALAATQVPLPDEVDGMSCPAAVVQCPAGHLLALDASRRGSFAANSRH